MPANRDKGLSREIEAREFLERRGLRCLAHNFHCRFGEIDLVMRDGATVCFVEVKYRGSRAFGGAAFALPPAKQRKLIKAAQHFVAANRSLAAAPLRFDALLIQRRADGSDDVEWIQNAFQIDDYIGQ